MITVLARTRLSPSPHVHRTHARTVHNGNDNNNNTKPNVLNASVDRWLDGWGWWWHRNFKYNQSNNDCLLVSGVVFIKLWGSRTQCNKTTTTAHHQLRRQPHSTHTHTNSFCNHFHESVANLNRMRGKKIKCFISVQRSFGSLLILSVGSRKPQQITFVFVTEIWNFRHFHYYDIFCCARTFARCSLALCARALFATEIAWVRVVDIFFFIKKHISQPLVGIALFEIHCAASGLWHSLPPPQSRNRRIFYNVCVCVWERVGLRHTNATLLGGLQCASSVLCVWWKF